jgi:hypothetical protein
MDHDRANRLFMQVTGVFSAQTPIRAPMSQGEPYHHDFVKWHTVIGTSPAVMATEIACAASQNAALSRFGLK